MSTIRIKRNATNTLPTGLTFGEPAFVDGLNSLYVAKVDGTSLRVGAEIDTSGSLGTSDNKIPTQKAVKTYVDASVAAGAVTSVNGLTGAVTIYGGSGISVAAAGGGITLTNTGVVSAVAGTGISVSGATGAVTFTNTGVQSAVAGNQITVSGATGAVTIGVTSNPSFTTITTSGNGTVGGNLTVTGNLTINGTSTTVNTDTMTIDDPMIILGLSGGLPLTVSDGGKWRGIAFSHYNGGGLTGFFGHDPVAGLVYYNNATIANDIVTSGTIGNAKFSDLYLEGSLRIKGGVGYHVITSETTSNKSLALATHSEGYFVVAADTGTENYILSGTTAQPVWIDPTIAGFTAYAATQLATARNIALTGNVTATGVAFNGTAGITLTTVIPSSTVTNAMLVNGGFTLGSTNITLGSTGLTLAGLSSVTATTFNGALTGNASTASTLQTTRAITLGGDLSGTANFNGSADITITAAYVAGSILDADINASAGIVDTKLATISTANKVSLSALDIDGGTVTTTIIGSDLLIVDDGANGTNRKVTVDNLFGSTSTAVIDGGTFV
jgi:hypothetical protein